MRTQGESMATTSENIECMGSTMRRRHKGETSSLAEHLESSNSETVQQNKKYDKKEKVRLETGTYWLTRTLLLRSIACMYRELYILSHIDNSIWFQHIGTKMYLLKEFRCWL